MYIIIFRIKYSYVALLLDLIMYIIIYCLKYSYIVFFLLKKSI
jgi:hypothetical protein